MSGKLSGKWKSRILLAIAAVVMLPAFVTPLWTIRLTAPQYSDGLGMHIYVHDVRGHDRHDLQNINILNHYIGMQPIEPEEIPELEIMPWVLGGLVVTGLVVAAIGSPWLMAGWLGLFLVAGAAGMVDFYLWNIDYGHNLSPDAPIRIPDMTYSPPIIGTAQILNIRASSYPHMGSLFLAISALLAGLAVFLGFRARGESGDGSRAGEEATGSEPTRGDGAENKAAPPSKKGGGVTSGTSLLLVVLLAACGPGEPASNVGGGSEEPAERIVYGESQDPYCGGTVEQIRWGGELRTTDGERLRFRSVECLAAYLLEGKVDQTRVETVKVVDFPDGWKLLDAERATFLHTPNLSSPNGLNILAIEAPKMQQNLKDAYTGPLLSWSEVLELVSREWEVGDAPSGEIS